MTEASQEKVQESKEDKVQQNSERTFTQAEMDAVIADRLKSVNRKHADDLAKFADYDDLKAKAEKFDEIEAANKTELEKANEQAQAALKRAEKAEQKAAQLEAQAAHAALVAQVASDEGVPADLISGADEESLKASAQALKAYIESQKPAVPKVNAGGATPAPDNETKLSEREKYALRAR